MKASRLPIMLVLASAVVEGIHYDASRRVHIDQDEIPVPIPQGRATAWVTSTSTSTAAVPVAVLMASFK